MGVGLRDMAVLAVLVLSAPLAASADGLSSFSFTTVGVANLDTALALWETEFGFEIAGRRDGPDAALARRWNISPNDIARQAVVRTPDIDVGMLHLVEFFDPDPPVREGALAYDLCPKNLDVYTDDLPQKIAALRERGRQFSNPDYSEVTAPNGMTFREIHMPSHDRVNVVLLQILGQSLPMSARGVSGIGMLITIVPDAEAEKAFYRDTIGLDLLSDNLLKGPEIEKMVGLPAGSALDVSIWGRADSEFGRIEIIEYQGVEGNDLYPRAKPKSLGILRVGYLTNDLQAIKRTLADQAIDFESFEAAGTLVSDGAMLSFASPAGMMIEVHQK